MFTFIKAQNDSILGTNFSLSVRAFTSVQPTPVSISNFSYDVYHYTEIETIKDELDQEHLLDEPSKISLSIFLSSIILFTVFGNMLTIIAVCTQKRLQTVGNMYIMSLACADLIVSSTVMSVLLLTTVIRQRWILGQVFCDIWSFVEYVSFTASLTNVALIAWDRYNTVAFPLKALRRRTKRRALFLIIGAWVAPTIFWMGTILLVRLLYGASPSGSCYLIWQSGILVIFAATVSIYMPLIAIIALFTAMMYYLRGHMTRMNERMRRNTSVRGPEDFGHTIEAATEANTEEIKPTQRSSLLSSTAISISALSLDAMSSFSFYDESIMFRSLESLTTEATPSGRIVTRPTSNTTSPTAHKTVATSTSPERFGLVRSIGVNTSPATYSHLPDVANVGYRFTRDTYHRGIKRVSYRRDFHKNRFLNVDHAIWMSHRRHSVSLDSDRSTSVESEDGQRNSDKNTEAGANPDSNNFSKILKNIKQNSSGSETSSKSNSTNNSVIKSSTNTANNITNNDKNKTDTKTPNSDSNKTIPPVEPVVKIKLGEIGRQQSVDVDNITKITEKNTLRKRYRNHLATLGHSGSSESDTSQKIYLRPSIKLKDRSLSDESNDSDQGRYLQVKQAVRSESNGSDEEVVANNRNSCLKPPRKGFFKSGRSASEESNESSNKYLRVKKKLADIGHTSSNESTDSRYLRVEPRVRFSNLGHSASLESADNLSLLSSLSHATTSSLQDDRRKMTAEMKRQRYASVMRKERQTTLKQCRLRQQMRAAKTLGLIAGFLLICWLPFAIIWPWKTYCPDCLSERTFQFAKWAMSLNSAINPIIYCLCNAQFRRAFRKLVLRKRRKNR